MSIRSFSFMKKVDEQLLLLLLFFEWEQKG